MWLNVLVIIICVLLVLLMLGCVVSWKGLIGICLLYWCRLLIYSLIVEGIMVWLRKFGVGVSMW